MEISKIAAQQLLDEFTKSTVFVTFSDNLSQLILSMPNKSEEKYEIDGVGPDSIGESEVFSIPIRPFSITFNNHFISHSNDLQIVDPEYANYIETLRDKVLLEIENNINLRIGKWDILNYLTSLESELKEIRNNFNMREFEVQSEEGVTDMRPDPLFEIDEFAIYNNSNVKIKIKVPRGLTEIEKHEVLNMDNALSRYWGFQINVIERILRFIEPRKSIIEKTDDYVKVINTLPPQYTLQWTKTDTDLLELIIALHEAGAIQNATRDLTQKEAIQSFSDFFGKEIKDRHKKLNAARYRKKEDPGFIPKIQKALESYYQSLEDKL
jgi:hypothetical protein